MDSATPTTEWFEIFTEDGQLLGQKPRSAVHRDGDWHRASHVFLLHPDGRLWLQQRAIDKDICGGCWDLSVGEHLTPGESWLAGALRGVREELNVHLHHLQPLGAEVRCEYRDPSRNLFDRERQMTFLGFHGGPVQADPNEVAAVRLVSLAAVETEMAINPEHFTPWFRAELDRHRPTLERHAERPPEPPGRAQDSA